MNKMDMIQMIKLESISEITTYMDDLKAIIFDLDDTLYPLETYVQSGFRQISRLFLGQGQDVYDQLWNAYKEHAAIDAATAVVEAIDTMLRAQGLYSAEMREKCLRIYEQHRPNIQPYDGVMELLERLRDSEIRLGMIIDGPPEMQREKLRALGVVPFFDEIIFTDEIAGHGDVTKFRKPNSICFEIMQLRLGVPFDKIGLLGDVPFVPMLGSKGAFKRNCFNLSQIV